MGKSPPKNFEDYILGFPKETQNILKQIRLTIKKAAPAADETIKYGMPTFVMNGNLVYFAAFKKHIGLYPVPRGKKEFEKAFSQYKTTGKGTIQFPLDKPIPFDLITKIVKFRIKRNK